MATEVDASTTTDPVTTSDNVETMDSYEAAGVNDARAKVKQVTDKVLDSANKAADSSRAFLSKVAKKVDKYADIAQQRAGDFQSNFSKALHKSDSADASTEASASSTEQTGVASRDVTATNDSQDNAVKFPLSILTWCSSLCGGSKSGDQAQTSRELPTAYLTNAANRMSTAFSDAASKLEEAASSAQQRASAAVQRASDKVKRSTDPIKKPSNETTESTSGEEAAA